MRKCAQTCFRLMLLRDKSIRMLVSINNIAHLNACDRFFCFQGLFCHPSHKLADGISVPQSGIFEHKLRNMRMKEKENLPPSDESNDDIGNKHDFLWFQLRNLLPQTSWFLVVIDSQHNVRKRKRASGSRVVKTADLSELKRLFSRTDQSSENIRASTFCQRKELLQNTKEGPSISLSTAGSLDCPSMICYTLVNFL